MKSAVPTCTIGKAGLTAGVVSSLTLALKTHKHVRVSFLPSSGRNRTTMKLVAQQLVALLPVPCEYTIIGFTIALRKRSMPRGASRVQKQGL